MQYLQAVVCGYKQDGLHVQRDRQAVSSEQVIGLCGGRAALCV